MNAALALAALLRGSFEGFAIGLAGASQDAVPGPMTLEHYLHEEKGLARWHADLLVRYGCVSVLRAGARYSGVQWSFALRTGDRVLVDESGAAYQAAYRGVPAKTYAMIARHDGTDPQLLALREILSARGAVDLSAFDPSETIVEYLSDFVLHLRNDHRVTGPVRDIVIGSHATWGGRLSFATDVMQAEQTVVSFETLDAAASSLALSKDTFLPRPNPDPGRRIVLLGCDAGDAKPLLTRLRQAIDPETQVIAPKHWWGTMYVNDREDMAEFLGVAHMIYSPKELTRDELIDSFKAMGARDANGDAIAAGKWTSWVPDMADVPANEPWRRDFFVDVKLPEVRFLGQRVAPVDHFDVTGRLYHWRGNFPPTALPTSISASVFEADPVQALKDAIVALAPNPRDPFTTGHPYPWWQRFRVHMPPNATAAQVRATIGRWVDMFFVLPERVVDSDGSVRITASGMTDIYVLVVPATDRNGVLFVNYYPNVPGAPQPAREDLGYNTGFWEAG